MMTKHSRRLLVLLIIITATTLSCSRKLGYGVVLWSDQDGLPTGALTEILEESRIRKSYILQIKGTRERFEIPSGVSSFLIKMRKPRILLQVLRNSFPFLPMPTSRGCL